MQGKNTLIVHFHLTPAEKKSPQHLERRIFECSKTLLHASRTVQQLIRGKRHVRALQPTSDRKAHRAPSMQFTGKP